MTGYQNNLILFSVEKLKESPEVQEKIIQSAYEQRYDVILHV